MPDISASILQSTVPPHGKGTTVVDVKAVNHVVHANGNGAHTHWQDIAESKRRDRESLLDSSARIPNIPSEQLNATSLLHTSNLLTPLELEITSLSATTLAQRIAEHRYTSTQVIKSFIKSSTIAQDATNCLTEIFYQQGITRAKELDEYIERTGKTVGPVHGVPVSVKDHVDLEGTDGASGFVGWCYKKIAKKDAVIVRCLREAGAVLYCKTSNPQSLLAIETENNIYGRTVNPHNRNLGAGGSSGGEGALIAMRGSPLGVGTDIAGSIRIPALWNGVYGLKPSVGRLPHTGLQGPHDGMDAIIGCVGPLGSSIDDLELFCSSILVQNPWHLEAQNINKPWVPYPHDISRKLKIAVMYDDGICAPHPPITSALRHAVEKLKSAGHEIFTWEPLRTAESEEMLFTLCLQDGGAEYYEHLELPGEPPIPMIDWLLRTKAPVPFTSPKQLWSWVTKREVLRQQAVEQFTALGNVDIILCPGAPTLAPRRDKSRHWGYTSMWNVLDWPGVTFPVDRVEGGEKGVWPPHEARNEVEEFVWGEWKEEWYVGAPVGLQVVGRRLEEEKLLADLRVVESALRDNK